MEAPVPTDRADWQEEALRILDRRNGGHGVALLFDGPRVTIVGLAPEMRAALEARAATTAASMGRALELELRSLDDATLLELAEQV